MLVGNQTYAGSQDIYFRHHPEGRGAGSGVPARHGRENTAREGPRGARRRCDRGGLPSLEPGGSQLRRGSVQGRHMAGNMRPHARRGEGHRRGGRCPQVREAQEDTYRHRHFGPAYTIQVQVEPRGDTRARRAGRALREEICGGRGVLCRGCRPYRRRIPCARGGGRDKGGGDGGQHTGHYRVLPALRVRRQDTLSRRACGRYRQGRHLHALP